MRLLLIVMTLLFTGCATMGSCEIKYNIVVPPFEINPKRIDV